MTVLRTSNAPIGLNQGKPISTYEDITPWTAPSDWLTFTDPSPNEQKIIGTVAIFNQDSNYLAVNISTTDSSQYTVDWGDGTSTNHISGSTAEKNYTWSSISSGTLTSVGYRQAIVTITPTISGRTFSLVSLSRRPSAIVTNVNTTSPWLNISVSAPNAAVEFFASTAGAVADRLTPALLEQVKIISSNQSNGNEIFRNMLSLRSVIYNNSTAVNSTSNMFNACRSLQVAPFFNTGSVTNMSQMFQNATSLRYVPLYNTSSVTNMQSMFLNCVSLETVPLFNTSNATNMAIMFSGCESLKSVPLFDTSKAPSFSNMFLGCSSLKTIPEFDTPLLTGVSGMFNACDSLESIPLFNTSSVTNFTNMFAGCVSLNSVPLFDTSAGTTFTTMFNNCQSLQSIPLFNTSAGTSFTNIFTSCTSLREIPELNLGSVTTLANSPLGLGNVSINSAAASLGRAKITGNKWTQTFQNCLMGATQLNEMYTSLATLNPAITNASGTGAIVTYTVGTGNISPFVVGRTVTVTGVTPVAYNITGTVSTVNAGAGTFTITNAATGTYVSGGIASITSDRTITVTGNPGVATDDPTIATNKGWTVTG